MNLERIRKKMAEREVDCLIVTDTYNFIYTIGEEVSGYMFITQEEIDIVAPRFYLYELEDYNVDYVFSREDYEKEFEKRAEKYSGKIRADTTSETLRETFDLEKTDMLNQMRTTKTSQEVRKIQEACKITDNALTSLREELFDGLTEFEAVNRLNKYYCDRGVTEAFLTNKGQSLVQKNSLRPHRSPTQEEIREDDLVIVDTGARKDFYCSDVTRTYCESPSEEQIRLFEAVKQIQQEEIEMIEPGKPIKQVKKRELEMVEEQGYNPNKHVLYYSHSLGIEVHESPSLTQDTKDEFEEGMVVTIEPGLHVKGLGGVRIEDTVVVTDKGAKRLSESPRKL